MGALRLLAHLGHGGDDAHRAAEILQPRLTRDKHLQAEADDADKVHGVVPRVAQAHAPVGLLDAEVDAEAGVLLAVRAGIRAALHGEVMELDLLAVTLHRQVVDPGGVAGKEQAHVAEYVDALPVDGDDAVAGVEAVGTLQRASVGKAGDGGRVERLGTGVEEEDDDKAGEEVHGRAGGEDQQLFPKALTVQRRRVVGVLLFPFHGAEAAHGEGAEGIPGVAPLLFPQNGAHADGKFVDADAAGLGGQEVAQFVDGDEHAEHQQGRQDIYDHGRCSL